MAFSINKLSEYAINKMRYHSIWTEQCPVQFDDLRLVEIIHYNFKNQITNGRIIVHKIVAESTVKIFKQLLEIKFPIHSVRLIDEFTGDDKLSMALNNSSGFNFRKIENSNLISMHSYGLAIDINPRQNPYIIQDDSGVDKIYPESAREFLDRSKDRAGMVEKIVHIFKNNSFTEWGGDWKIPIDYHHFQVPRKMLELFVNNGKK